jgi:hypothetical protein
LQSNLQKESAMRNYNLKNIERIIKTRYYRNVLIQARANMAVFTWDEILKDGLDWGILQNGWVALYSG